jgi:alpha-glucosidase
LRKHYLSFFAGTVVFITGSYALAQTAPLLLTSPNQQLVMHFGVQPAKDASSEDGKLIYSLSFRGKPILDDSGLALELDDQTPLGNNVHIVNHDAAQGVDDYTLSNAKVSKVHDAYNSVTVHVQEGSAQHRSMTVEARAYNDGIAFRYLLPAQDSLKDLHLRQEDTEFRLSTDATNWALALPNYRSSYESEYVQLPTSALSNQGGVSSHFLIGLPLLMHEPGAAWLALMEADLEDNSAMYVTNPSGNWAGHWFVSRLSPRFDHPDMAVESTLPHHSAWRVLMVADDPGRLVESTLTYDLNPANRLTDTSWIHPGKASWNWWVGDVQKPAFPT